MDKTSLFLNVIESNKGIIYKVANSYCKDAEDRKDLVQEIISQLWKSFDTYNDEYKLSTWMYRISLNTAISFYRKEGSRQKITQPLTDSILSFSDNLEHENKEAKFIQLQLFINDLREIDKAIMLLYLEDKSYKQIAETVGITETNVATKISRIKLDLKNKFSTLKF